MTAMRNSDTFCLVCDMTLEISSCTNIFYTSLPHNGELLASFVLRVLRPAASDLRSSYICARCYNLFQMLEQAQWTAANIRCEILKVYKSCEKNKFAKDFLQDESDFDNGKTLLHSLMQQEKFDVGDTLTQFKDISMALQTESNETNGNIGQLESIDVNIEMNGGIDPKESAKDTLVNITDEEFSDCMKMKNDLGCEDNQRNVTKDCEKTLELNGSAFGGTYDQHHVNSGEKRPDFDGHCQLCEKSFESAEELNFHLSKHESYECQKCEEKFQDVSLANLHTLEAHSQKKDAAVSKFCENEVFHLLNDNLTESEEKVPTLEGKKTSQQPTVQKQISPVSWKSGRISKYSLKPLKYTCTTCGKKWRTSAELNTHMKSHSNLRPYMCEKCGQAYKHKHALEIHVGMHNGINPFQCSFCNKCFTQKGALMRHLPMHTGETPYQCELCGKRFVHHTSYNMHALSHTGKKSYRCHICDLSLLSTSHLKRHMRVHTGEKPYSCSLCGKRFAERYNLFAHQKIHDPAEIMAKEAKKMQHKCEQCSVLFDKKQKLEDHKKLHHVAEIKKESENRNWLGHNIGVEPRTVLEVVEDQSSQRVEVQNNGSWPQSTNYSGKHNQEGESKQTDNNSHPVADLGGDSLSVVTLDGHRMLMEPAGYHHQNSQVIIENSPIVSTHVTLDKTQL